LKKLIKNNNVKLELLNPFQKLIFNQQRAASQKVPPEKRGPRPSAPPITTPQPGNALPHFNYRIAKAQEHITFAVALHEISFLT